MKRFMAFIAVLVLCLPLFGTKALTESTNYATYKKGQIVNFYRNHVSEEARASEDGAVETIVLEDKGTSDKFVRVLLLAQTGGSAYYDGVTDKIVGSQAWVDYTSALGEFEFEQDAPYDYIKSYGNADNEDDITWLTLDEAVDLFGATKVNDTKYNIDITKSTGDANSDLKTLKDVFELVAKGTTYGKNGFFLGTTVGNNVWVVKFATTGEEVTGATIEQVAKTSNTYGYLGVGYMNKTADCHEVSYACYVCDGTYGMMVEGSQGETCTIVPNVTKAEDCVAKYCYNCNDTYVWKTEGTQDATCTKVDTVTSEANCVKSPKTGLESHVLEFAIVAALCAIALLVVKRKDLFRTI